MFDRITQRRKALGLTQVQLAEKIKVSPNTINRFENGHRVPDANQVIQLGEALDCSVEWLLTGHEGQSALPDSEGTPYYSSPCLGNAGSITGEMDGVVQVPGLDPGDVVLPMAGDAMSPRINDGDLVLIQRGEPGVNQVAFLIDQWGGTHVRWRREVQGQSLYVAENPQYPPLSGPDLKIWGRVVAAISVRKF